MFGLYADRPVSHDRPREPCLPFLRHPGAAQNPPVPLACPARMHFPLSHTQLPHGVNPNPRHFGQPRPPTEHWCTRPCRSQTPPRICMSVVSVSPLYAHRDPASIMFTFRCVILFRCLLASFSSLQAILLHHPKGGRQALNHFVFIIACLVGSLTAVCCCNHLKLRFVLLELHLLFCVVHLGN